MLKEFLYITQEREAQSEQAQEEGKKKSRSLANNYAQRADNTDNGSCAENR